MIDSLELQCCGEVGMFQVQFQIIIFSSLSSHVLSSVYDLLGQFFGMYKHTSRFHHLKLIVEFFFL